MPLTPFLEGAVFRPDEIAVMVGAYEAALREMDLTSYNAPGAATLAKTIVMLPSRESAIRFVYVNAPSQF